MYVYIYIYIKPTPHGKDLALYPDDTSLQPPLVCREMFALLRLTDWTDRLLLDSLMFTSTCLTIKK